MNINKNKKKILENNDDEIIENLFDIDEEDLNMDFDDNSSEESFDNDYEIENDDDKVNIKINVQMGKDQEELEFNLRLPKSVLATISKFINK